MLARFNKASALAGAFAVALAVFLGAAAPSAFAEGVWTATATPYYYNPGTGTVEDSGGDAQMELGTSMVQSATYGRALIEQDASGNYYVTFRIVLATHISNLGVDLDPNWSGSYVGSETVQTAQDGDNADYRVSMGSDPYQALRVQMYVSDMGRNVIFFITVGDDWTEGNTDGLAQTIDTSSGATATTDSGAAATTGATSTTQSTTTGATASKPATTNSTGTATTSGTAADSTPKNDKTAVSTSEKESEVSTDSEGVTGGAQEYDQDGNAVEATQLQVSLPLAGVIAGGIVLGAGLLLGVGYLVLVRPHRKALADAAYRAAVAPLPDEQRLSEALDRAVRTASHAAGDSGATASAAGETAGLDVTRVMPTAAAGTGAAGEGR